MNTQASFTAVKPSATPLADPSIGSHSITPQKSTGLRVVIIEDEEDILHLVEYNLTRNGIEAYGAMTGEAGILLVQEKKPDLVLLDLMLPDISGIEVCTKLRQTPETSQVPIIMVSARGEEADIVLGLERGADDYITKPFSPKVLLARTHAVVRRRSIVEDTKDESIRRGPIFIVPEKNEVYINDSRVRLTYTEFFLLLLLARKPGWVFTRHQIVDQVRGENCAVTDRSVDVQVVGLRRKLGPCGALIETVRGIGYRFREDFE